ncbi:MAG: hypothetical protein PHV55_09385, partial [Candidatus Omnitrophica bacterium]|nr:hypothetical protein [Candidatus Omnitrophota bacterium]
RSLAYVLFPGVVEARDTLNRIITDTDTTVILVGSKFWEPYKDALQSSSGRIRVVDGFKDALESLVYGQGHSITASSQFAAARMHPDYEQEFTSIGNALLEMVKYAQAQGEITLRGPPQDFTVARRLHDGTVEWPIVASRMRADAVELIQEALSETNYEPAYIISHIELHESKNTEQAAIRAQSKALERLRMNRYIDNLYKKMYRDRGWARVHPGSDTLLIRESQNVRYGKFEVTFHELLDPLVDFAGIREGARVFDFGSGDGWTDYALATYGANVSGAEVEDELFTISAYLKIWFLTHAQNNFNDMVSAQDTARLLAMVQRVSFQRADIFNAKIDFSQYDVVYLYYPEPDQEEEYLRNLNRVLSDPVRGLRSDAHLIVLRQLSFNPIALADFTLIAHRSIPIHSSVHVHECCFYRYKVNRQITQATEPLDNGGKDDNGFSGDFGKTVPDYGYLESDLSYADIDQLWKNILEVSQRREVIVERMQRGFLLNKITLEDAQEIRIAKTIELSSFSLGFLKNLKPIIDELDYDKISNALDKALENIWQHAWNLRAGDIGALLMRFQVLPNGRGRFIFILLDRGDGFIDKHGGPAPIHEAVLPERSFGKGGKHGMGLTIMMENSDRIMITTVARACGKHTTRHWEKGFTLEEAREILPVDSGSCVVFIKEMLLAKDLSIMQGRKSPLAEESIDNGGPNTSFQRPEGEDAYKGVDTFLAQKNVPQAQRHSIIFALRCNPLENFLPPQGAVIQFLDNGAAIFTIGDYPLIMSNASWIAYEAALLDLQGGESVLEIGTGTGRTTSVVLTLLELAQRGGLVYTVEQNREIFVFAQDNIARSGNKNVNLIPISGNGISDIAQLADEKFDRILVRGALSAGIPEILFRRLAPAGVLIAGIAHRHPRYSNGMHKLWKFTKQGDGVIRAVVCDSKMRYQD